MGKTTGIEWTTSTYNPWQGCTKVSSGCRECYMFREKEHYGQDPTKVIRSSQKTFNAPLNWKLDEGSRIFVCSWSDFFHADADEWRPEAWDIIRKLPQYKFLIPTKRTERIGSCLPGDWGKGWKNVCLGASVEDQPSIDKRLSELLEIPSVLYFLSVEPMLGPINLTGNPEMEVLPWSEAILQGCGINWIVCGSESGPNARPCNIDWVRSLRDQCVKVGVPFFLKQMSIDGILIKMPSLDGKVWSQLPPAMLKKESFANTKEG